MTRSIIIMVSNDQEQIESVKRFSETHNCTFQTYSPIQWKEGLERNQFRQQVSVGLPALAIGFQNQPNTQLPMADRHHQNVVPFPSNSGVSNSTGTGVGSIQKMEDLELKAIENAIMQFNGNLTEAAKALGIGRATLYRRVKYFKLDPNMARKKRAIAA